MNSSLLFRRSGIEGSGRQIALVDAVLHSAPARLLVGPPEPHARVLLDDAHPWEEGGVVHLHEGVAGRIAHTHLHQMTPLKRVRPMRRLGGVSGLGGLWLSRVLRRHVVHARLYEGY